MGDESDVRSHQLTAKWRDELPAGAAEVSTQLLQQRRSHFEQWERDFGEKVKQWRNNCGWSQEQVAAGLRHLGFDMHQTTVAKIERGTRPLRVAEAVALAHVFRVPALAIFEGDGPEGQPEDIATLQRQLARAKESAERRREEIDYAAKDYAAEVSRVAQLANRMKQAATQAEGPENGAEA